ncbi:hypothetical protein BDF14DRAFT_1741181 [Spinellus fusiger]|nr:hypothetical protein BDF14DRAFT_1741181 [Spinellus fusiger]
MGQKTSKHHAPLTFAYILKEDEKANEDILFEPQEAMSDFVLANPHLYKLDVSYNGSSDLPDSRIAISDVSEECPHCKKNKRLSLVKRHLVDDLAYIDETYYPDISHYNSKKERVENEIIRLEEDNEEWAKLTIADVTQKRRRSRKLNEPKVSVNLSGRSLVKLSPSIGFLDNLTSLNLSHNQMTSLPLELGYLKNLRVLNASSNQLESIPDTIAFLSKLKALNIGHNKLTSLPRFIGVLPKLLILLVHNNSLKEIPREMANLRRLVCLSISDNPLESIPAEIATVTTLQKLIAERCSFKTEFNHDLVSSPPSLFELCARAAIREALDIPIHLPAHIKRYLGKAQSCSYCHGPYIESHVVCGRFIERSRQQIALEYRLCSPHWNTEDERILNIFSNPPFTLREVGIAYFRTQTIS